MMLRDKLIDVKNIKEEDKYLKAIEGSTLSIQVDGDVTLTMKGSHSNFPTSESYDLAMVNMTTLEKLNTITGSGLYLAIVEGVDNIEFDFSGTGKVHIKELGD